MMKVLLFWFILFPSVGWAQQPSDYDRDAKEFAALEAKGKKLLKRGMTPEKVKMVFGNPQEIAKKSKEVEMWSYKTSISGTYEYWLVFITGKLDFYGTAQTSWLWEKYLTGY